MFHDARPHPNVHILRLQGHRAMRRVVAGGALILVGVGTLLHGQGLISREELWLVAPAVVALSGLVRFALAPGLWGLAHALVRFAIAAYLVVVIEHIGGWTFAATWPVLLIALGAGVIARALCGGVRAQEPNW
jgi:hypothetical protein